MKKLLVAICTMLSVAAMANIQSATLTASGLTCAMCSKAIYTALSKVSFVQEVNSNIRLSTYTISFKAGANIDFDIIKNAVEGAGFTVAALEVAMNFTGEEVKNDTHLQIGQSMLHFVDVKDQVLQGDKVVILIDKNYISSKAFKKYKAFTSMPCYQTGYMQSCCNKSNNNSRIYHVTLKA